MSLLTLLAQSEDKGDLLRRPVLIIAIFALAATLLVGAGVVWWVDKWRKRQLNTPVQADELASLTDYREMYEQGEITEAEYVELRRRVVEKARAMPGGPPGAASTPSAPGAGPPTQLGERTTVNLPAPPAKPPEPPPPA